MSATFITFEGLDGSGKTTQLELLANELKRRGFSVAATREPGGTDFGKRVRALVLDESENQPAPLAELLLFAADRAHHCETLIRPALAANQIVLSDRFADATRAYQGGGRGFDSGLIERIVELATNGLKPDLTVFFDLPVAAALARIARRTDAGMIENRLDRERTDFFERVRGAYLQIARREPARFQIVDANCSISEIHQAVLNLTITHLTARSNPV